jgi:TolA-binding protein
MSSFAISLLFIVELALALGLAWLWFSLSARIHGSEAKLAESLDSQDLMDFQDKVGSLLKEVRESGAEMVAEIKSQRASLEREQKQAAEAERRLAEKLKAFEKAEALAEKRIEEILAGERRRSPRKPPKAAAKTPARQPPLLALAPAAPTFSAPEPRVPTSPTASRYLRVYELADLGRSREEIGKETGYLPGEIDLILNLRPKTRA